MTTRYDIFGFGNALVDVIVEIPPAKLEAICRELGMARANSNPLDSERMQKLDAALGDLPRTIAPGGSATNVICGAANLGARVAVTGIVAADPYGALYVRSLESIGATPFICLKDGRTGTAVTLVTPDAERTFGVDMGVAPGYLEDQLPLAAIAGSRFFHVTVYELVHPLRPVVLAGMAHAKRHGVEVSLDLASVIFIERMREDLVDIIRENVDVVFANEEESQAFVGEGGLAAVHALGDLCKTACVKMGPHGAVCKHGILHRVPAYPAKVVDTNGAGDAFAAGFLTARARGYGYDHATRVGCYYAARTVEVRSARLNRHLDIARMPL